jgi:riboflavin synthase
MFTGLVSDLGTVRALDRSTDGTRMTIATALAAELAPGDSIAVNGVCLTATELAADAFSADVIAETLQRSSLGELGDGARVNLELPVRAADRLGGHVVQGHVDGVGVVADVRRDEAGTRVTLALDPALLRYVVEKGSIALDGVSLTVAAVDERTLTVALIPETLARTTFGATEVGTRINVEVDVLAKHVEKLLAGADGAARAAGATEAAA